MRAEIINVGTELLIGSTLNTHQQYLARELGALGIDLYTAVTLGDNPQRLAAALTAALFRSDLIIVTGGLGPTDDDITVAAAAKALGLELRENRSVREAIRKRLKSRSRTMDAFQARQALVPEGAAVLPNPNGTAAGVFVTARRRERTCHVALLPGPPRELYPMFRDHLAPRLKKILGPARETLVVERLFFPGAVESEIAPKVNDWLNAPPPVTAGIYARAGEVELAVMSKHIKGPEAARAAARAVRAIHTRFKGRLVLRFPETLPSLIAKELVRRRRTLCVAESCTGGLLAGRLTDAAGASDFFKGGVVAYDNAVKVNLLGVPDALLEEHGAVSARTAKRMAQGARERLGTDYALSVTGIAGPGGGTAAKPVGRVYIGLAAPEGGWVFEHHFLGKRPDIRAKAVQAALTHLGYVLSGLGFAGSPDQPMKTEGKDRTRA
jgi:nicotinamide-nucleotide amidase